MFEDSGRCLLPFFLSVMTEQLFGLCLGVWAALDISSHVQTACMPLQI